SESQVESIHKGFRSEVRGQSGFARQIRGPSPTARMNPQNASLSSEMNSIELRGIRDKPSRYRSPLRGRATALLLALLRHRPACSHASAFGLFTDMLGIGPDSRV